MNVLVILQGPAYGTEASYNGLRLAGSLAKRDVVEVKIFCFGHAVGLAVAGQQLPNGYHHLDRMLTSAARHGAEIGLCGSCMDARGITDTMLVPESPGPASTRSPTGPSGPTRRSRSDRRALEGALVRRRNQLQPIGLAKSIVDTD